MKTKQKLMLVLIIVQSPEEDAAQSATGGVILVDAFPQSCRQGVYGEHYE